MKDKFVFFLPTRKGSERVKDKNTIPFAGVEGGILKIKLEQLLRVQEIDEIILSTNDEKSIEIAERFQNKKIKIIERPEYLCLSSTVIEDFINYIPTIINGDHVFWVHTTAPFVTEAHYKEAMAIYKESILRKKAFDSLLSVTKIQQFLWDKDKNECINHDRTIIKWPRTQDLKPIYEINHAFYLNSIKNYLKYNDRIGKHPYLYELGKIDSFDIDWEEDFIIAEEIYIKRHLNNI